MKKTWVVVCVLAMALTMTSSAWGQAQITTGVIQGTVLDASGGVVPGATVEVKNLDTNFTRTLTTNEDGRFVALQLPPGRYEATVTKSGFARLVQQNIALTVGQSLTLTVNMKVAAATETVTVTATPTVDTIKTEMSSTLNDLTVSNTPILGRKFEDLLTLTPGVSVVQGPDGDEITFNGQRGIFNNFSVDGGDFMNGFFGEQAGGQRVAVDITLEAVKEFQVVASGANAEFGRTAGGVVNIITKSGTNEVHGSLFHFQRHENLSSNTSDGKPLRDFHREQFGGTIGGPIIGDKVFYFFALERIIGNLQRDNLSTQLGTTACPVTTPTILADEAAINANEDCQRLALISFIRNHPATLGQEEGNPVRRPLFTTALIGKLDFNISPSNQLAFSYNFNASKKVNETFDVATYGNSANGIEGNFTKIHNINVNLFSSVSPTKANEAHFTYLREERPRTAVSSSLAADTGIGFAPSFRFGAPFFLQPAIDETFWRSQIKDNFSIVWRNHTVKFGGEWIHSLNDQVFRGFFTGRYLFDSVNGFLRYASPAAAGGFGPNTQGCSDGTFVTAPTACGVGTTNTGTPLLLYLQGAGPNFAPATDAAGASNISNEEFGLFIQDKWQIASNFSLSFGLRWDAQIFPDPVVPPSQTAYAGFLGTPAFPSNGRLKNQNKMFQPRIGFAWDVAKNGKSVLRWNAGIYNARQNMLTQVGSITTNGVQQTTIAGGLFANPTITPTWPNTAAPAFTPCLPPPALPFPCFTGVRAFHSDYHNPRVYTTNVGYEQEIYPDWSLYTDFTWSKAVFLTRFFDYSKSGLLAPQLGESMITTSFGQSLYRGWTIGMRKRFSKKYQLEWNYVLATDYDDDSNERDPFTDRGLIFGTPRADYGYADRDIRHKFNFITYAELPWKFRGNIRMQARTAQPISPSPRAVAGDRNTLRKDNEFFSLDWRLERPFHITERVAITPVIEMFNTFNNKNNVNPLSTAALFDFNGFLRFGVGDPRQAQIAVKLTF